MEYHAIISSFIIKFVAFTNFFSLRLKLPA